MRRGTAFRIELELWPDRQPTLEPDRKAVSDKVLRAKAKDEHRIHVVTQSVVSSRDPNASNTRRHKRRHHRRQLNQYLDVRAKKSGSPTVVVGRRQQMKLAFDANEFYRQITHSQPDVEYRAR